MILFADCGGSLFSGEKKYLPQNHKDCDVKRVKYIEKVFGGFSLNETALAIVHVDGEEGEAGLPFVVEPAASNHRLGGLVTAEPVHNQQEYIPPPSVIRIQKDGYGQKAHQTQNLHGLVFPEIFDGTKGKIPQQQGKKHVLFLESPGVGEHEVPGYFRHTGEEEQVQPVFAPVPGVEKALHQQKTEDGKGYPSDIPAKTVKGNRSISQSKKGYLCRGIIIQKDQSTMVNEHGDDGNHFQSAAA